MITNARVLKHEFVPNDVVHRDAEIDVITSALEPITNGEVGETTLLFGPAGTGKTCIAKYLLERLREAVIDLNTEYVNCWDAPTRFKVLYRVLAGINKTLDIHRQSTPTDELVDRLHAYDGPPYVAILDEVDQLPDTNVLYDLYRTRHLTLVLIANSEEELFSQFENRVTSRMQTATRVHFDTYDTDALVAILEDRVRLGLEEDAITTDQLATIADAAAGDARVAISILRGAAREADQEGADAITDTHIAETVPHAKSEIMRKNTEKLNEDQQILYDIIMNQGEIQPTDIYSEYQAKADDPKTDRMVRYYLEELCHYDLIRADGENRGRTYRPVS